MISCPHCQTEIVLKELPHQGLFRSDRLCPQCGKSFTVDADTKRRQAIFILITLIALTFTLLLYFRGSQWLLPALSSYLAFGTYLFWANRKVFLVPYNEDKNQGKDS